MNELVSIIMPAHNASKTIGEAIESVISQKYTNWELLVIDDSSEDETVNIVLSYIKNESRIRLLYTDKTYGKPFYPRNIGINSANGRYIAFLDSDDIWLPCKLEHQIPLFDSKNIAIVFSYYEKFYSSIIEKKSRIIKSPKIVSFKTALYGNPIGNLTGIYDTKKVGKIFFKNYGHEDYILWLTILQKGYIAKNTESIEARYRVSKKSISSNKRKAAIWTWNIYRNILKFNIIKSIFYYCSYVIKGIYRYLK